jgi:hypothetical protein
MAAGHRIRVTVGFPHLLPAPAPLAKLLGGRYDVQRSATAPSSVTLPLIAT